MKQRKYFDISVGIGRKNWRPDGRQSVDLPYKTEELISDMENFRIHGALCYHNEAVDYSFIAGNREMSEIALKNKRLCFAAQVPPTYKYEAGNNYLDRLKEGGAKAFYFNPAAFHCPLRADDVEPVVEFMVQNKMPLIINYDNTDYHDLNEFLKAFPELNVIAEELAWARNRQTFMLLEKYPNLYFDIGGNQTNNALTFFKENFGTERMLYGSIWPIRSMGAIKSIIEYADVSEQDKDLVAFGNAMRLLNLKAEDFPLYSENDRFDGIAKDVDSGKTLDFPVIDVHSHIISAEDRTSSSNILTEGDIDSVIRKMDRLGIDKILTAPIAGITTNGITAEKQVLEFAKKYPGRVYGYLTCNIDFDEDLEAAKKFHAEYPEIFIGIKPYWPNQNFDMLSDRLAPWFEYANEQKMFFLYHSDASQVHAAEILSERYPDITFIMAHSGTDFNYARSMINLANSRKNVYLDMTITICTRGMTEFLVKGAGADKILFATDLPMRDPAPQIGWICYADISEEDKKKIMGGNMRKLMDKYIAERK